MKRSLLTSIAFALLIISAPLHVQADPLIEVGSYIVPAVAGTPFVVPIQITGAVNLTNCQFDLFFEPTDLQINVNCDPFTDPFCHIIFGPVTEGPFFLNTAQFPTLFVPGFIVNSLGWLLGVAGAWQDPPPGPSGDGILAYVEFIALGDGTSEITLDNILTTSSAIPEPTTLLLLTGGLAYLSGRGLIKRRRRTDI